MPISWPESLIHELADRRCIVVAGAGASAASVGDGGIKPPLWNTFLTSAIARLIRDADTAAVAQALLKQERFLDCAEVIKVAANDAEFAMFVRETFVVPHFEHARIHELILSLDPKVVVTTNYDEIYDHYCQQGAARQGYNVCKYYESHALNALRSPQRVILKAHGCVTDPAKIVLSRSDYFQARRSYPAFYNILDALFLVNTAIFIGCGLTDPDLQLILENANLAAQSSHPHYAILERGTPEAVRAGLRRTYNIEFLEYTAGRHNEVVESLELLEQEVILRRSLPT